MEERRVSEKEGSEITVKGSGLSGKLLCHLKTHMQSLLGLAPRKHSVTCANQTAASTKGGFQLGLGIPCFPKLDSPHTGERGGSGKEAFLRRPLAPASCTERALNVNRPVTTCGSPALVHEAAQLRKNINPPRTHGGSHAPKLATSWSPASKVRTQRKSEITAAHWVYFSSRGGGGTFT